MGRTPADCDWGDGTTPKRPACSPRSPTFGDLRQDEAGYGDAPVLGIRPHRGGAHVAAGLDESPIAAAVVGVPEMEVHPHVHRASADSAIGEGLWAQLVGMGGKVSE